MMVKLSELSKPKKSKQNRKRIGRGIGSGHGKTSGRGMKGQKSRSGKGTTLGFEGGQMPLKRRLPKIGGFKNPKKIFYAEVNLDKLTLFKENDEVTPENLVNKGLVRGKRKKVKILGQGKLNYPLIIKAHAFSKSALQKIEEAGGKAEVIK